MTHTTTVAAGAPSLLPAKQFQIVQTAVDRFEIRYVPDDTNRPPDEQAIRRRYREMVHPTVDVTLVAVTKIPKGAGGKFQDFIYLEDDAQKC